MPTFIFNHKHFNGVWSQYEVKYLSVWRPTSQDEKTKKWMYLPSERQRSRFIMALIDMWNFENKCHLQHAFINVTELFWTRTKVQICADCSGRLRTPQPFLSPTCCSMYSQSHARTAVTQLHIHTVAASSLDICTENAKHLDLKSHFICNVFNINSIKSAVFTAHLRWSNNATARTQMPQVMG